MKKKSGFEIHNKPALYTGLAMQVGPVIIAAIIAIIWAISKINFYWIIRLLEIILNEARLKYYAVILAIILYYATSWLLVKMGVKK
jgi:hypothetical protein